VSVWRWSDGELRYSSLSGVEAENVSLGTSTPSLETKYLS